MSRPEPVLGPASFGLGYDEPFPAGVWVELAPGIRHPSPGVVFGGTPPRLLRLSARGVALMSGFSSAPVGAGASAVLARRLTDAGIAVPRPERAHAPPAPPAPLDDAIDDATDDATDDAIDDAVDVTVVVPVRDRPRELADCLASLGRRQRVLVVDDGSRDATAVAVVCRRHGASLVRVPVSKGPAAARNTGLRMVTSELVAFVDSDCVPAPDAIARLAAHFVDPLVVGVAPRIVAVPPARGSSLLDLGKRPASVHPAGRVPYVPAAAVVFRRTALGGGYDERLRYGEDVDLVWRLSEAGWRIRYEPDVEVGHQDPATAVERCHRRFCYGTSVGALERAHPGAIDHLTIGPGPALALGALLVGSPGLAACAWAAATARLSEQLRPLGARRRFALALSGGQLVHAWLGLARWCTSFGLPVLAGAALARRRLPGRRTRRATALLVATPVVADRFGPSGTGRRVVVDGLLGELAYGLGVMVGCARAGVIGPLVPRIGRRRAGAASRAGSAPRPPHAP
ncbi:MAG: glycosyltransferase [Acidimicrobiales bacterium]